jgi:hypothetical protein
VQNTYSSLFNEHSTSYSEVERGGSHHSNVLSNGKSREFESLEKYCKLKNDLKNHYNVFFFNSSKCITRIRDFFERGDKCI